MAQDRHASSPIPHSARRLPGHSLREKLMEERYCTSFYYLGSSAMAVSMIVIIWIHWWVQKALSPWMLTFSALALVAVCCLTIWTVFRRTRPLADGLRGEMETADWLDDLVRMGYHVYHDLPSRTPRGEVCNVDHVAVGPAGVFVIETKYRSKGSGEKVMYDGTRLMVGGRDEGRALGQARACRDDVRRRLEAIGLGRIRVRGVVVLPGWWVTDVPKAEIWVLNPKKMLAVRAQREAENEGVCDPEWVTRAAGEFERWSREG